MALAITHRGNARRRDRHGRGPRGPLLPVSIPAWRTRADIFDDSIAWEIGTYRRHLGADLERFDFAVMDVPDADPAPWEEGVPLSRFLPFERPGKIHGRIIFYRMPILQALKREDDVSLFLHAVVTSQLASALGRESWEIDFL